MAELVNHLAGMTCDKYQDALNENNIYEGSYSAHGSGGQFITVIPKLELVIAHKTDFIKKTNGKKTPRHIYYQIVDFIVNAKI